MSDKKHIDRVFQEKLKDFEVSPNSNVWGNIQNTLNEQKGQNKKAFPIWLKYAGIAATLILLLTIGNLLLNSKDVETPIKIVDSESLNSSKLNENKNLNSTQINAGNQNSISSNIDDSIINDIGKSNTMNPTKNLEKKSAITENNNDSKKNLISESPSNKNSSYSSTKNNMVINGGDVKKNNANTSPKFKKEEEVIANNSFSQDKNSTKERKNNSEAQFDKTKSNISNSNYGFALNQPNTSDKNVSNQLKDNPSSEKSTTPVLDANDALNTMKENTGLVNNESEKEKENTNEKEAKKDSTSIEEAIAKAEDLIEKEEGKVNRWQVYANIAPVYYNTIGNGSHIHDQFVNNPKTGEINTSYGVNVGYALNEKLTLRSGLNSLNLSYDTDNVILYESVSNSPDTNPLRNITFAPSEGNITVLSASNIGVQQINGILGDNYNAAISQRISYYEVPLELEYGIVNNNLGLNVIAGFSTFILDGNEVYSEFDDRKIYIGEANNITNVSFSTNIGLGLNYKFTDKLKFNLEPTFKYQLNAFKETSGSFKPYIIGVYTGFSYKF